MNRGKCRAVDLGTLRVGAALGYWNTGLKNPLPTTQTKGREVIPAFVALLEEKVVGQRRFAATKSQFTSAQNDSTYFGRALR